MKSSIRFGAGVGGDKRKQIHSIMGMSKSKGTSWNI